MGEAECSIGEAASPIVKADPGLSSALAWTTFSAAGEAASKCEAPTSPAIGLSTCSLPAGICWNLGVQTQQQAAV